MPKISQVQLGVVLTLADSRGHPHRVGTTCIYHVNYV